MTMRTMGFKKAWEKLKRERPELFDEVTLAPTPLLEV
jgi:hypothetical protein